MEAPEDDESKVPLPPRASTTNSAVDAAAIASIAMGVKVVSSSSSSVNEPYARALMATSLQEPRKKAAAGSGKPALPSWQGSDDTDSDTLPSSSSGDESFQDVVAKRQDSDHSKAAAAKMGHHYASIKRKYRETAQEIAMSAVQLQGGRFLKKHRNGVWKEVSNDFVRKRFTRDFKKTCQELQYAKEAPRSESPLSASDHSDVKAQSTPAAPTGMSFERLTLDGNGSDRNEAHKFAKGLALNTSLRSLQISLSSLDEKANDGGNLVTLNLLARGLSECKHLEQVKLQYDQTPFESVAIVLMGILENSSIESLNLDNNVIDGNSMRILCKLLLGSPKTHLKRLSLQYNPIGDIGAAALEDVVANTQTLRYLSLRENMITDQGSAGLEQASRSKKGYLFEISGLNLAQSSNQPPPRKQRTIISEVASSICSGRAQQGELEGQNSDSGSNSASEDHKSSLSGYAASRGSDDGHSGTNSGSNSGSEQKTRGGSSTSSVDDDRSGTSSGSDTG